MLTLSTVKTRLAITVTDYDAILTGAIKAVSTRYDEERNHTPTPKMRPAANKVDTFPMVTVLNPARTL